MVASGPAVDPALAVGVVRRAAARRRRPRGPLEKGVALDPDRRFLHATWVAETNVVLIVPLVLILTSLGALDRRALTAVWAAAPGLHPVQRLAAAASVGRLPRGHGSGARASARYGDATLIARAALVVAWQVAGWWIVVVCLRGASRPGGGVSALAGAARREARPAAGRGLFRWRSPTGQAAPAGLPHRAAAERAAAARRRPGAGRRGRGVRRAAPQARRPDVFPGGLELAAAASPAGLRGDGRLRDEPRRAPGEAGRQATSARGRSTPPRTPWPPCTAACPAARPADRRVQRAAPRAAAGRRPSTKRDRSAH